MNAKHEYMTVADIGTYLNISRSKAYALTKRKDFPVSRFGGSIRIPRSSFLVWVDRMTYLPAELRSA